ncbi:hypothetical protein [Saliphagus sp. LR7]|uniref:DUF7511 domain-containing protein n=1 Tax=Saliphagus sp. LR7 TaxID=2282654 RepID=UPI000DF73A37|nr:hypothetical protein [Saliphagus sp. LR7]
MSERTDYSSSEPADPGTAQLEHAIVVEDDRSECTIFPRACPEEAILTRWITADETSHVPLTNCR